MRNFELLKILTNRRQTGYTSAIKKLKNCKFLISKKQPLNKIFGLKSIVTTPEELIKTKEPIIPDNSFLYGVVKEVDEKMQEYESEIVKLKYLIEYYKIH